MTNFISDDPDNNHIPDTYVEDIFCYRHWHGESEKYAGGDSLVTLIFHGWTIESIRQVNEPSKCSRQYIKVYHFELRRDEASMIMPIIGNPYVERLVMTSFFHLMLSDIPMRNQR